jgi:tetratricopeptide (TPR) repeat protein
VLAFWQHVEQATGARTDGDCARARGLYLEALRLDPSHEDSLYYLGQCQRNLKRPVEARQTFEHLVELNPTSARGHLALGALLASPDSNEPLDLQTAEAHLRRAHEINKEETGPMLRLGEVLIVDNRVDEAREWLEAAARTNPKSVEAAFLLGYLRWKAGDTRGASAHLKRAAQAARADVTQKPVVGEGDRTLSAAAPLREPMGRTLFGELATPLGRPEGNALARTPDVLYRAVDEARRAAAARRVA